MMRSYNYLINTRLLFLVSIALTFTSCKDDTELNLKFALKLAGENSVQLKSVLNHYKDDTLKYEAAKFLISNMPYHFSLEEYYLSLNGDKYRPDISIFKDDILVQRHCDSLINIGYRPIQNKVPDIKVINAEFLIDNIDLAFKVWEKPWAKDISFHDFCRYVLPYRAQVESISPLRAHIMNQFIPLLDSAQVTTSLEACIVLNEHLKSVMSYGNTGLSFYPTIEETYMSGIGRCEGLCNLGAFIMRAVGIPVAIDNTTWVKMDLGHSWCAVLDGDKFHSFGPGEDQPDKHSKLFSEVRHRRPAKVYRSRFDLISPIGEYINDDGYVTNLKSPLIYDVTNEYLDTPIDITIIADEIEYSSNSKTNQIYLCVRNFYEWKPIAVGSRTQLECNFKQVVGDNIFIIADSPDGGMLRFITAPFYVSKEGDTRKFIPDIDNLEKLTLDKRSNRIDVDHMLQYWDTDKKEFVTISPIEISNTTQSYTQVPHNSLLWFGVSERIVNQRVFFVDNGNVMRY